MSNWNNIPEGWRKILPEETIKLGDYYNLHSQIPEQEPYWMPYQKFVGFKYSSLGTLGITPIDSDRIFLTNRFNSRDGINVPRDFGTKENNRRTYIIDNVESKSSKTKIEDYLKKIQKNKDKAHAQ
jgi:hypothetical protein